MLCVVLHSHYTTACTTFWAHSSLVDIIEGIYVAVVFGSQYLQVQTLAKLM